MGVPFKTEIALIRAGFKFTCKIPTPKAHHVEKYLPGGYKEYRTYRCGAEVYVYVKM